MPHGCPTRNYKNVWDDLSVIEDNLLVYDGLRVVVPSQMRPEILKQLHASHSGIVKTRKLAQTLFYWPGINADIKSMVDGCEACQVGRASQAAEPLQVLPAATAPMTNVSLDLFEARGVHYLIAVDRYSGWPFVSRLRSQVTQAVLLSLERWFYEWGFPRQIISDGGPQFRSEFKDWCDRHYILHQASSPYNSQSNGLAEAAVKSMKALLLKLESWKEFTEALIQWRNVPRAKGTLSPAELFLGRRQRRDLMTVDLSEEKPRDDVHVLGLPPLEVGTEVRLQHPLSKLWSGVGVVMRKLKSGRSYEVKTGDRVLWRNRRFLKPLPHNDGAESLEPTQDRPNVQGQLSDEKTDSADTGHEECEAAAQPPRRSARIANRK